MRVFRKRFIARSLAIFSIVVCLSNLVPIEALALTSGPHQPEYMGYEEPGAKDIVSLLTGDFTMNPVTIEVPGPEGSFSLPLTYRGGVGLEQEASWVGLGWTLNPGAITRNINGYPDDASGQEQLVTMSDPGVTGLAFVVPGVGEMGWNSVQGGYGALSILGLVDVDYGAGRGTSVGIAGISVGRDGLKVDPLKLAMTVVSTAVMGAIGSHLTAAATAKISAWSNVVGVSASMISLSATPSAPKMGYWQYQKTKKWAFFLKYYKIWLDQTRTEQMYGTLNLASTPSGSYSSTGGPTLSFSVNGTLQPTVPGVGSGSASDINFNNNEGETYATSQNPFQLATDVFSVGGAGISGAISPYRFDVGSVATPREMTASHSRFAPVPFHSYKVPFMYDASFSNAYFHSVGKSTGSGPITQPDFYYGLGHTTEPVPGQPDKLKYELSDLTFGADRMSTEADTYKAIPQANQVNWYTNTDVTQTTPYTQGFVDFLEGSERTNFRGQTITVKSKLGGTVAEAPGSTTIGGYSVTRSDGVTFHYALPVYDYNFQTKVTDKDDDEKFSLIARNSPFANTWLLTSITGPDFVDRNSNGVADRNDWGYWVRLHYGKHSQNYKWRNPYSGATPDYTNEYETFSEGEKQQYYLNSIETRSHRAVFMKSERLDNQGHGQVGTSLRLDEVCVLKNEDFDKIVAPTGSGGCNRPTCSNSISKTWNTSEFYTGSAYTCAGDIVKANAVKRIKFNYDYDLCKQTPNSFHATKGKLTLKSVSMIGRNDVKVMPDYVFQYADNPDYDANKWDAWGYYSSTGTTAPNSHIPKSSTEAAAWSLTKITNPMGSELLINYERDIYKTVASQPLIGLDWAATSNCTSCNPLLGTTVINDLPNANTIFSVGEEVVVDVTTYYSCSGTPAISTSSKTATITALTSNTATLSDYFAQIFDVCSTPGNYANRTISIRRANRIGGNLRVGSLVVNDQGNQTKIRYKYSQGTVSREPETLMMYSYPFYDLPNYPATPVMYGRVEVLTGALTTDTDFDVRQQYDFEVPYQSLTNNDPLNMLVINTDNYANYISTYSDSQIPPATSTYGFLNKKHFKIDDYTSKIGTVKAIRVFDRNNVQKQESIMTYSSSFPGYQGVFTESTIMAERVINNRLPGIKDIHDRIHRTTTRKNPYILVSTTSQKDGFTSISANKSFDMITGKVVEKVETSPTGISIKSVSVPAYTKYPGMASRILSNTNKHMLAQDAATYVYRSDANGNVLGLLDAEVTTWKKDWNNYRVLSSGDYVDQSEGPDIWRQQDSWSYFGNYSDRYADGSMKFTPANEFNFASGTNTGWTKTGQNTRYDHYGAPLEAKSMNLIAGSTKMGYGEKFKIATASNASYTEMAFSGAEDINTTTNFFGGEVAKGSGTVVTTPTHTGYSALSLTTGYGFTYKTNSLTANRKYRASVWCNSSNGRIYYKINGGAETVPTVTPMQLGSGPWHLIQVEIPITTITSFEVGVKSAATGSPIVFDDFRFQPIDASLEAMVYDVNGQLKYVLDNNNMFAMYEYDDIGVMRKVWKESFLYNGVKLISESKDNYRRFYTNQ